MQSQVHPDQSSQRSRQSSAMTASPTKEHFNDIVDLSNGIPRSLKPSLHSTSEDLQNTNPSSLSSSKTLAARRPSSSPQLPPKDNNNLPSRLSSMQQAQPNGTNGIYSQFELQLQRQTQRQQQDYSRLASNHQTLEPSPTLSAIDTSVASISTSISSPASSVSYLTQNNTLYTSPAPAPSAPPSDVPAEQHPPLVTTLRTRRSSYAPTNVIDLDSTVATLTSLTTLPIPHLSTTTSTDITTSVHTIATSGELPIDPTRTVVPPVDQLPHHSLSPSLTLQQEQQLQEQKQNTNSQPLPSVDVVVTVSSIQTSVIELDVSAGGSSSIFASEPKAPMITTPRRSSTTLDIRNIRPGSQFLEDSAAGFSRQPQVSQGEPSSRARRRQIYRRNTYSADLGSSPFHRSDDEIELDELEEARRRMEALKKSSSRRLSKRKKEDDNDRVLIGTRIGEDHVNYVLMYNMLTGIRVSVSRCNAKPQRALVDEDFRAAHKLAFDITGNELTPSSKYDFKFKDYAPWVFRHLRQDFHIDASDYLVSLTSKYILSELGSPGKSGSFFYFSQDYRFIIKTIHHAEHKFMRKILKDYFNHVKHNPHTLLCRFFGLHRVKLPHGRKIHFVVMGNVFPPNRDIHETYDLKGSTLGRAISDEELQSNPRATQKDLNWVKRNRKLELGPEKRHPFVEQIKRDVELLARLNIMDYSLLVGIHDIERGNKDNIRDNTLKVFHPDTSKPLPKETSRRDKRESKVNALRMAVKVSDPVALGPSTLPSDSFSERRNCIFYADDGGLLSTNERNERGADLYYLGIIDILTPYNYVKKIEHAWKSLSQDKHAISAVNPHEYAQRFLSFMIHAIKVNHDVLHVLDRNSHPHSE
ncbi:Phosphatidylinositol-4-phosphate 5-kinase [Mortierella sp. AM989]|nr:Phosphatidylinositol-4-phosphate 5-kinase [Mortierella sp. AM989]